MASLVRGGAVEMEKDEGAEQGFEAEQGECQGELAGQGVKGDFGETSRRAGYWVRVLVW